MATMSTRCNPPDPVYIAVVVEVDWVVLAEFFEDGRMDPGLFDVGVVEPPIASPLPPVVVVGLLPGTTGEVGVRETRGEVDWIHV